MSRSGNVRVKIASIRSADLKYVANRYQYIFTLAAPIPSTSARLASQTLKLRPAIPAASQRNQRQSQAFRTQTSRQLSNMASATTFYDFKPLDSMHHFPSFLFRAHLMLTLSSTRARPTRRPPRLQRQGRPRRQHGVQVRLHPAVRRPGEALQGPEPEVPGPVRHPRLPLQPVRGPGAGHQRRHRVLLPAQLRRLLPHPRQDGRQRRPREPAVRVAQGGEARPAGPQAHQVEL